MGKSNLDCGQFLLGTPSHFCEGRVWALCRRQRRGPPGAGPRLVSIEYGCWAVIFDLFWESEMDPNILEEIHVLRKTVEEKEAIIQEKDAIIKEKDGMIRKLQQDGLAAGLVRLGKMQIKNISFQMQCLMSV